MSRTALRAVGLSILLAGAALADAPATQPAATQPADAAAVYDALAANGAYQPVVRPIAGGRFDWSRHVVQAAGQAKATGRSPQQRLMAMRGAETVAKRNALLLAADVPIDAAGRVGNLPNAQIDVDGVVRGARPVREDFDPRTRIATVTIDVPLAGLAGLVQVRPRASRARAWTWAAPPADAAPADLVVIDARSLKFEPVLAPRLVTEAGLAVFEPDIRALAGQPAFVFVSHPAGALTTGQFVADRTVVLTASRCDGESLVLTSTELTRLSARSNSRALLTTGRAVIVLSKP